MIAARSGGIIESPYEIKNSSIDLSLYVGEQFNSGIWRAFASWLVGEELPIPRTVLDIGCENGILTCLLASMSPASKVIGIDCVEAAILAARELAARLKLENVTFEKIDARQFLTKHMGNFSIITAILSMHEILKFPGGRTPFHWEEPYWSLEQVRLTSIDHPVVAFLEQVRSALTPSGLFISLDRSPSSATTWWYAQCLQEAGVRISFRRSSRVDAKTTYGAEKFPIIVAERTSKVPTQVNPDDILSLMSLEALSELRVVFENDVEDLFIRGLGHTEVMFEANAAYINNSGIRRLRLLRTATFLVLHDFTDHGYVKASLAPVVRLGDVIAECQSIALDLEGVAKVTASITDAGRVTLERFDYPPLPPPAAR